MRRCRGRRRLLPDTRSAGRRARWVLVAGLLLACEGGTGGSTDPDVVTSDQDVSVVVSGDAAVTGADVAPRAGADVAGDVTSSMDVAATGGDAGGDASSTDGCGDGVCTGLESCEVCPEDCPICPPAVGALVITEIMKDPDAVTDSQGEWIELVNVSDAAIELNGMVLRDLGSDEHVIDPTEILSVAPGQYVVLGVTGDLGVGLQADYVVSGFYLDNDADEVIVEFGDVILDSVVYDETNFADPIGASLQFHGGQEPSAEANDDGGNWCAATTPFGDGDLGSPGEPNPPCDECGDGVCGVTEVCDACVQDCGACTPCDQGGEASDEYCNGVDDDCDDAIDEDTCSDGLGCTTDWCVPGQGCAHEAAPGGCAVDGYCISDGAYNPNNSCQYCDEDNTQIAWTDQNLGPCNDDDPCTTNDLCVLGQCDGSAIQDTYEHNDSKTVATQLGGIGDGADWPAGQIGASLFGPGDEDWYHYTVSDDWLGSFAPRADLTVVPSLVSYQLCLYMVCDDGEPVELKNCTAGEEATSADGMKGCCSTESVQLEVDCDSSSESGSLFVHVTRLSGPWTCDPYAFQWGDD
ncbi:MAG: lamin tail domain-containing protein [Myxococcota bacterium]|nr:lamin tail domain-containing protein [Myxococcota bacterium]